jgi:hypothetical protein
MESIETGYLMELQFMAEASIDIQFQAWMAVSFAVVIATYTGRKELGSKIRIAISILYLMTAYALYARWMTEGIRLDQIQAELAVRALQLEPVMYSFWARLATCVLGTLAMVAAVFIFRGSETHANGTDT